MVRLLLLCVLIFSLPAFAKTKKTLPTRLPAKGEAPAPTPASSDDEEGEEVEPTPDQAAKGTGPQPNTQKSQQETAPVNQQKTAGAQRKRVPLDSARTMRLTYGLSAWNKDPRKIDTASVLLREGQSGRIVQIYLEESAPDSSTFSGLYSVTWGNIEAISPEFYIPPQELLATPQGLKKLGEMIKSDQIKRKPFILRREKNGLQSVEVFDTKDQAQVALKAYRAELQAVELQNQKIPAQSAVEAARLAEEAKRKEAEAAALTEQIRLEQIEKQKAEERLKAAQAMAAAEIAARKQQALQLANEAMALYRQDKFQEAQEKFDQSIGLDPENKTYYYYYGIALYRTEQFNRSIVVLEMATGPDVNEAEKQYYLGLNYYRLKNTEQALATFKKVRAANQPALSPSASFYQGLILFEDKKYKECQEPFQWVLDNSSDPLLDERAEAYLENAMRILQFEDQKAKKFRVAGMLAPMYDSNVLSISDSAIDQGTATDLAGYRMIAQGTFEYRPVFEKNHEFSVQFDALDMYSVDSSFKSNQDFRNSDPLVLDLSLPYKYKGVLGGKGYSLAVVPGYETIYMSAENNENKAIINSFFLNLLNTLVVSDTWFTNYNLEMRQDTSLLDSSVGDDDSSAFKTKVGFGSILFTTKDKKQILTTDLAHTINTAKGKNNKYNRTDFAVGYILPGPWELTWNTRLAYYTLAYGETTDNRRDNNLTFTGGFSRKLTNIWSVGVLGNYSMNNSNVPDNAYKKWSVMTSISGSYQF